MNIPLEEKLPYTAMALGVLVTFYGIYLGKQWAQKRQGIRTVQLGRHPQTRAVERLMSVATVGVLLAQLLSIALGWSCLGANARFTGFLTAMAGNLIFLVSVLTMKNSWRAGIPETDKTELVTGGIYRFSRNPAFLGFDLQYLGVLLMFANPLTLAFSLFAAVMLHMQILQEERFLENRFGEAYVRYRSRVCRYLGRR